MEKGWYYCSSWQVLQLVGTSGNSNAIALFHRMFRVDVFPELSRFSISLGLISLSCTSFCTGSNVLRLRLSFLKMFIKCSNPPPAITLFEPGWPGLHHKLHPFCCHRIGHWSCVHMESAEVKVKSEFINAIDCILSEAGPCEIKVMWKLWSRIQVW